MSLVLLRGKADSAHNNPCFMTSPPEFTTFEFPISNYFNFQILLEVVVIQRKNCRDGSRHSPKISNLQIAKIYDPQTANPQIATFAEGLKI
jgi:hypothetical protein